MPWQAANSCCSVEILFAVLYTYLRKVRTEKLQKAAEIAASHAKQALPVVAK